jgi:hypothetical protein
MANTIYPLWKAGIIQASANTALTGNLKVALVNSTTFPYSAANQFFSSVTSTVAAGVALATKTYTNGTLGAASVVFTAVPGPTVGQALVLYVDSGVASTSPLVAYIDTATNLPVTPNGGDITITWNASGIFAL